MYGGDDDDDDDNDAQRDRSWQSWPMAEGSLEVKLPTIWTDRKAEVESVREEKVRRKKIRQEKEW